MGVFKVNKDQAKRAAENAIINIEEARQELFNNEVCKVMQRRFFKPKSKAEAEKLVKKCAGDVRPWEVRHGAQLNFAEDLADACRICLDETIKLNTAEAAFVAEWGCENNGL